MSDERNGFEHLHKGAEIIVMFTLGEGKPMVCTNGVPIEYEELNVKTQVTSKGKQIGVHITGKSESFAFAYVFERTEGDAELRSLTPEESEQAEADPNWSPAK